MSRRSYFDARAGGYAERGARGLWGALRRAEWAALSRVLELAPGMSLLELGCGAGQLSRLARDEGAGLVEGVDESPLMIEAYRAAGFGGELSSVEDYAPRRRYERVLLAGVLEFAPDPGLLLAAAARCVAKGGLVACLVPRGGVAGAAYRLAHEALGCPTSIRDVELYAALAAGRGLRLERREPAGPLAVAFSLRPA